LAVGTAAASGAAAGAPATALIGIPGNGIRCVRENPPLNHKPGPGVGDSRYNGIDWLDLVKGVNDCLGQLPILGISICRSCIFIIQGRNLVMVARLLISSRLRAPRLNVCFCLLWCRFHQILSANKLVSRVSRRSRIPMKADSHRSIVKLNGTGCNLHAHTL
jgi:hypothetical protein